MSERLRYFPVLELGRGGMADVLLAYGKGPAGFGKLAVLKQLRRSLAADASMREMFLAEARLSARLNHANVVQVYEVIDETVPAIVMEYLEGHTLAQIVEKAAGALPLAIHLRILSDVLVGLHYAHEARDFEGRTLNIVHRDATPQNVMVAYDGSVKVLDFGIAKVVGDSTHTSAGIIKGKLGYMACEQLLGQQVDRRADVYSVGCMLWEAATGTGIRKGDSDAILLTNVLEGRTPSFDGYRPVAPKLQTIICKAMAPDANDRYPTARALQADLEEFVAEAKLACSQHDISEFVGELFELERAQLVSSVRSAVQALQSDEQTRDSESHGNNTLVVEDLTRHGAPKNRRPWGIGILALALALLLIGLGIRSVSPEPSGAVVGAQRVSPVASAYLSISALPWNSKLFLDGKELPTNPAHRVRVSSLSRHRIVATAEGYVTEERTLQVEKDETVAFVLRASPRSTSHVPSQAQPTLPAPLSSTWKGRAPTAKATPPSVPSVSNCNPPYYFDGGIKVYKRECFSSE